MIVIGSALSALSIWSMVTPKIMCQDNINSDSILDARRMDDLVYRYLVQCNVDEMFYVLPIQSDFIFLILSICLIAFGAAIYGMIIRLGR